MVLQGTRLSVQHFDRNTYKQQKVTVVYECIGLNFFGPGQSPWITQRHFSHCGPGTQGRREWCRVQSDRFSLTATWGLLHAEQQAS